MPDSVPSRRALRSSRQRRKIRKWVLIGSAALLLVIVGIGAWIVPRALAAKDELEAAIPLAKSVQAQLMSGETDKASRGAKQMAEHTAAGRDLTGDWVWQGLEWIPWAGENLKAVRLAAVSADDLARNAVVPAATINIDSFKPVDGRIDVDAIRALGPLVDDVISSVDAAESRMASIDRSMLISQVQSGVSKLDDALEEVGGLVGGMKDTVAILPAVLGADGPRNYVMLFENNAETRGTGGNPAALLLLTVDDGLLDVTQQASSSDFPYGRPEGPILPVDAETEALYGNKIARHIQDVTLTPHFPYTAELASAFWSEYIGGEVDGVMSFDPVALGYLLKATGPVTLPTGETLTSENAAPVLLNETYFRYPDPKVQDVFFAAAAASIFDAVKSGQGSTKELIDAIGQSVADRRLNFWSANPDEQVLIAETPLAGILPTDNTESTVVGVYFNDNTGAKMDYYLDTAIEVTSDQCQKAEPTMHGTVTLTSTAPLDSQISLPEYVRGYWYKGGLIVMDLVVYGPVGGSLGEATLNDAPVTPHYVGTHLGRPAAKITLKIKPGQTATFGYEMTGAAGDYGPLEVRNTPMIRPVPVTLSTPGCAAPQQ